MLTAILEASCGESLGDRASKKERAERSVLWRFMGSLYVFVGLLRCFMDVCSFFLRCFMDVFDKLLVFGVFHCCVYRFLMVFVRCLKEILEVSGKNEFQKFLNHYVHFFQ